MMANFVEVPKPDLEKPDTEKSASELQIEVVREGITSAIAGDLKAGLSLDVLTALAWLKSDTDSLGQYLTLLDDLVGAHKSIRKTDIEKSLRSLLPDDEKAASKVSAADEIVTMVKDNAELFTDQEDQAYAFFDQDGHREVWPVNSPTFKDWVSMQQYSMIGRTPRAASLADAFSTLNGIARHEGETHHVYLRVASDGNGGYYLDVGDDKWRVIHITPELWQILDRSPVMFRRTKATKTLPIPVQGGKLSDLKKLVNIDSKDDLLLITVLIDQLRDDTAYPVIELTGGQGSGKSTNATNIRRLTDPNTVNLRSKPKSLEDYFVSARNNHCICLNNLSRLSADEQDVICNLSTGGGYASRKLYTNEEGSIFEAKRPVLLNGINVVATRPDLISRLVRLTCPPLDESNG